MPIPLIIGAISAIGSAVYLYLDWKNAESMEDSVSQMEQLVELLNGQMTFSEFLTDGWPFLIAIGLIIMGGYIVATPNKLKTLERRARRGRL